jgi:FkbM family methyltransferase
MRLVDTMQRAADAIPVHAIRARHLVNWELRNGEPELRLLSVLEDSSRDFLDVGANKGAYSFYALGRFRKVIAVEAHPDMVAGLRRIIKPENQVLSLALSDEVGETSLHIPTRQGRDVLTRSSLQEDANPGFDLRTVTVPMTTIDELELDRIGVIKIDVEGHESAVLRGGTQTLRTSKPTCIVECEERHNLGGVAQTFAFFDAMGYRSYFLRRGTLFDGTDFDAAALQRPQDAKSVRGKRSADYVNNFIFVHRENGTHLARIRQALA